MERKDKACWNCGYYKAYYTKGWCHFNKLDYGLCHNSQETVDKHNQCKFWKNNHSIRALREDVVKNKLNEISDAIVEIRQIVFEEREENQINPKNQ